MKRYIALFLCLFSVIAAAQAGPRTSASYSIVTDSADWGGRRSTSISYTNDGSASLAAGLSSVAAPSETVKNGFAAQLYDTTGLVLNGSALTVNETGTLQLAAWNLLDDTSLLAVNANAVVWGVVSGPISGISASGVATAGTVGTNTPATVQGAFGGFTGTLRLTVLDIIPDNFGSYAGDGLDDAWQLQYFGANNPLAAPNADPTGGGQNNLFKFIAGLNPLDPNSRFLVVPAPVPGQPGQKRIIISPIVSGRIYTVKYRTNLTSGTWTTLTGTTQSDNGNVRTIIDPNASGTQKFYRIEITKP